MNESDFGHARIAQDKKGFKTVIDCYGTIKKIERKFVLFEDNDGYLYLVEKKDFVFEKKRCSEAAQ